MIGMSNTDSTNTRIATLAFLLPLFGLILLSCSDDKYAPAEKTPAAVAEKQDSTLSAADAQNAAGNSAKGLSLTETSRNGLFRVTLQSDEAPLPLNRMHGWTAHLTTSEGRVIDDAIVMLYGGMPEHKHGFPSKPQVTGNLGNGRYRIEGVKFNMPGRWEIWINVRALGKDDKAIFSFDVS